MKILTLQRRRVRQALVLLACAAVATSAGLGPLALLAVLVIADQVRINRPGHKYRLTVEVETPEGIKSASGILAVQPDRGYITAAAGTPAPWVMPSCLISAAAIT